MRRGLAELADASRSLGSANSSSHARHDMAGDQKAFRILSQHAFDAEGLMKEVNSLELKTQYDPMERLEGTDIEGYLSHHHDMIILSAIDEARRVAEKDVADIQKRWATEEWVSSRRQMMEGLGHRSHVWLGGGTAHSRGARTGSSALVTSFHAAHVEEVDSPFAEGYNRSGSRGASSPRQQGRFAPQQVQSAPGADREGKRADSSLVPQQSPLLRSHADIVRKLHQTHQRGGRNVDSTLDGSGDGSGCVALVEVGDAAVSASRRGVSSAGGGGGLSTVGANPALYPATAFASVIKEDSASLDSNGMTKADRSAYRDLLEMTASMTGESEGRTFPAGYFSPVAVDHPNMSSEIIGDRRRVLSRGARSYLERQFEEVMVTTVDVNSRSVRADSEGSDMTPGRRRDVSSNSTKIRQERIRSFAQLETKAHRIPRNCLSITDGVGGQSLGGLSAAMSRGAGRDASPGVPVWPQVYFCLRSGALKEAQSVLRGCVAEGVNGVDMAALAAVEELMKLQERDSAGGVGVYHHITVALAALSKCAALYRDSVDAASPHGVAGAGGPRLARDDAPLESGSIHQELSDPYRIQVLNLLGLADLDSLCTGEYLPDTTTEDFLWCSLWFIHWSQILAVAHQQVAGGDDLDLPASSGPSFGKAASYTAASFLPSSGPLSLHRGASTGGRDPLGRHQHAPTSSSPARRESYTATKRLLNRSLPKIYSEGDILLRAIEAGGPDYFDPHRTAPFTYALILFCCHRFGEAISHLWQTRRSFPAIHLLVVCLHYGLVLPHTPLTSSSLSPAGYSTDSSDPSVPQPSPASLLAQWISSSRIAALDSCQKADYVVALNSHWLSQVKGLLGKDLFEVSRFKTDEVLMSTAENMLCSLNAHELSLLVGEANSSTGIRLSGHLDVYLEREVVNTILARTACSLTTVKRETQLGIKLYELAGMYVEVLEELCNQLSLFMILPAGGPPSSQKTAAREYWRDKCIEFYDRLLDGSTAAGGTGGVVTDKLQQAGRLALRVTFETLLNLWMFVDRCYERRYQEALDYIDNLGILPSSGGESGESVTARVHRFHQLEAPVRRVMDDAILLSMECIQHLYAEARTEGANVAHLSADGGHYSAARDKRMHSLRSRASALVTFAGYVQGRLSRPADTTSKLAAMDVHAM